MGLSGPYASQLASGQRRPSLDLAIQIEKELGIPPGAWVRGGDPVETFRQLVRPGQPAVMAAARAE